MDVDHQRYVKVSKVLTRRSASASLMPRRRGFSPQIMNCTLYIQVQVCGLQMTVRAIFDIEEELIEENDQN